MKLISAFAVLLIQNSFAEPKARGVIGIWNSNKQEDTAENFTRPNPVMAIDIQVCSDGTLKKSNITKIINDPSYCNVESYRSLTFANLVMYNPNETDVVYSGTISILPAGDESAMQPYDELPFDITLPARSVFTRPMEEFLIASQGSKGGSVGKILADELPKYVKISGVRIATPAKDTLHLKGVRSSLDSGLDVRNNLVFSVGGGINVDYPLYVAPVTYGLSVSDEESKQTTIGPMLMVGIGIRYFTANLVGFAASPVVTLNFSGEDSFDLRAGFTVGLSKLRSTGSRWGINIVGLWGPKNADIDVTKALYGIQLSYSLGAQDLLSSN